jgi:hypothetical protein
MLDLTYIFPDEPIIPDTICVLNHLPHSGFNRVLREALAKYGLEWHGALTTSVDPTSAAMHLGCVRQEMDCLEMALLFKDLEAFRWLDRKNKFFVCSVERSRTGAWVHLIAHT